MNIVFLCLSWASRSSLTHVELAFEAGEVQWCTPTDVSGVERGPRAVQPLSNVELTIPAGDVQWVIPIVVSGVDRGTRTVQPLGYVEVTL